MNKLEIEKEARELRRKFNVETYGIQDIFSFVEKMDIDLIRYPFGKDVLCGLAAIFEGKELIVSNSSEILAREIFTVAHELAHLLFDKEALNEDFKVDFNLQGQAENISERRADFFAACFLMPESFLRDYLKYEIKKAPSKIGGFDIIRIQVEFNVSYAAAVERLKDTGLIGQDQAKRLYDERNRYSATGLFRMLNEDEKLLRPTDKIKVPARFLEYVISNYENNYIPYSSLEKALRLVNIDASKLKKNNSSLEVKIVRDELSEELD